MTKPKERSGKMTRSNDNLFTGSVWEHQTHFNLYVLVGFARHNKPLTKYVRLLRLGYDNGSTEILIPLKEFSKEKFLKINSDELKHNLSWVEGDDEDENKIRN